jgi:outer membrane protein assembly factor BamE
LELRWRDRQIPVWPSAQGRAGADAEKHAPQQGMNTGAARPRVNGFSVSSPTDPPPAFAKRTMRKLLLISCIALLTAGCGILYKQPIYQGNLLEKDSVDQLQAGMSRQQVMLLLGSPSISDPFHHDRWDYTASQRTGRLGRTEIKNLTLYFEGDTLARWEGDYFPEQDEALAKSAPREFGRNLAKDKDKKRR